MKFGTCTLLLFAVRLYDTAILHYASKFVDSTLHLLTFFLVLAVILWHLSTSPMSELVVLVTSLPSSVSPAITQNSNYAIQKQFQAVGTS